MLLILGRGRNGPAVESRDLEETASVQGAVQKGFAVAWVPRLLDHEHITIIRWFPVVATSAVIRVEAALMAPLQHIDATYDQSQLPANQRVQLLLFCSHELQLLIGRLLLLQQVELL